MYLKLNQEVMKLVFTVVNCTESLKAIFISILSISYFFQKEDLITVHYIPFQGFLDKSKQPEAIRQKEKQMAHMDEELMKLLEKLDALQFEETNKGGRGKRKTLVDKIHVSSVMKFNLNLQMILTLYKTTICSN